MRPELEASINNKEIFGFLAYSIRIRIYRRGTTYFSALIIITKKQSLIPTRSDGSCLFRAFSHAHFGTDDHHLDVRAAAVEVMSNLPDEFIAFLAPSSRASFSKYLQLMKRAGTWAGHLELKARTASDACISVSWRILTRR